MHKKKRILFIMNNLNVGGAEKALVSLLQVFDYDRYEVDLYLFKKEGAFLKEVPVEVHVLPRPKNYVYFDGPVKNTIIKNLKKLNFGLIFDRICFGFLQKKQIPPAEKEQCAWKYIKNHLPNIEKKYDVAIGFLENKPINFCIDKVVAKKKIGFIHNDYIGLGMNPKHDISRFKSLDHILSVSENCVEILKNTFPQFNEKFKLIENISSTERIRKLSTEENDLEFKRNSIISVGRLSPQKNFVLAICAAEILKSRGYDFEWNIVGEGNEKDLLQKLITEKKLNGIFNLLGLKENPYSYISKSIVYVQPSKFEGKSIAIDEAKILAKPIILTNFLTSKDQITDGENGLIVEMNAECLANGIELLLKDEKLRRKFSENLAKENLGNQGELEKFYLLIES